MSGNLDTATGVTILIGTEKITRYQSYVVQRDIGQPDQAEIVLSTLKHDIALAERVEIKIKSFNEQGQAIDHTIYIGEVVSIVSTFCSSEDKQKPATKVTAMNRMHRLTRGRRSRVFENNVSDRKIVEEVAKIAGLTLADAGWSGENFNSQHEHDVVYWRNQTPLEFLSMRAERYGYHLWCVDDALFCKVPDLGTQSRFRLLFPQDGPPQAQSMTNVTLRSFSSRMSSAQIVQRVKVTASDPISGKPHEGAFPDEQQRGAQSGVSSSLGDKHAVGASGQHGEQETCIENIPVLSTNEANAVAKAEFLRRSLSFITADAVVAGSPPIELGTTVGVEANSGNKGDPFNGRYYVMGITHRWAVMHNKGKPNETHLRLARDARDPKV